MESILSFIQQWEDGVASTALKIRIQVTMLKFAIGLLASYPVAALLRSIPYNYQGLKHTLSMCTGLFLLRYVYGIDWMHGVVSTAVTYLICLLSPRKHVHVYVFVWAMGYMTLSHLYRMTFFYMVDQFDFTRTQMVLTMKLTSFAFNLYDGYCSSEKKQREVDLSKSTADDSNIKNSAPNQTAKSKTESSAKSSANGSANGGAVNNLCSNKTEDDSKNTENNSKSATENSIKKEDDGSKKRISVSGASYLQRISAVRARYEILDLPSPLEFGGYVFCFPNLLAGPAFVYQDYIRGIDPRSKRKVVQKVEQEGVQEGVKAINHVNGKVYRSEHGAVNEEENEKENGSVSQKKNGVQTENTVSVGQQQQKQQQKQQQQQQQQQQPSCLLPALHRLLVGVFSLIIFFIISAKAPIARQYDPIWQASHSFLYRLCFISISFFGERFKFYFAWKVSEGACIMGGFGYEGSEESGSEVSGSGGEGESGGGGGEKSGSESSGEKSGGMKGGDEKGGEERGGEERDTEGKGTVHLSQNGVDRIAQHCENLDQNQNQNQNQTDLFGGKKKNHSPSPTPALSYFGAFEKRIVTGWRGVENIDIITYETGTNIQALSRAWNKRTQSWLEQYVYQRTNRSLLCTYAVSALWHGLYPGFFLFFFAAALMSSIERLIRVKVNPLVLADPRSAEYHTKSAGVIRVLYSVLCWLVTTVTLTYHAQTFYMRSLQRSVGAFRSFYFIPNILFILVYFILELAPTPPKILHDKDTKKNL